MDSTAVDLVEEEPHALGPLRGELFVLGGLALVVGMPFEDQGEVREGADKARYVVQALVLRSKMSKYCHRGSILPYATASKQHKVNFPSGLDSARPP